MPPKHERRAVDKGRIPQNIQDLIKAKLPPLVADALYGGCNEMDFLLAAELLLDITIQSLPMPEPNALASYQRVREARLHLTTFNDFMATVEKDVKRAKSELVVVQTLPGKGKVL